MIAYIFTMVRRICQICHAVYYDYNGRTFFNYANSADSTSFAEHIVKVYDKVGKMVLVLDRAPWHQSHAVKKVLAECDIIVIWYMVGHPYLNYIEDVWNILKGKVDRSIQYVDIKSHLTAVFNDIKNGKGFNYDLMYFGSAVYTRV